MNAYDRLQELDYVAYRRCIETASGISINARLDLKQAAEVEKTLVSYTLMLLDSDDIAF